MRKVTENLDHNIWCPDRSSKRSPPDCKSESVAAISWDIAPLHIPSAPRIHLLPQTGPCTQLSAPIGSPTKPGERVASQWRLGITPSSYPLVPT
jgi:hypothetical protein